MSGEGSRLWGGRWNPPGLYRAVYLSLTVACATEEALAQNRRNGLPDIQMMPLVIAGVEVRLARTIDLTNREVQKILGVTLEDLVILPLPRDTESITQAIGRIAYSAGYEGLLVPSAALSEHQNLVIFPENLVQGTLAPVNPGELPPKRASG